MNWKLIFLLSLFGLAMAYATIDLIPEKMEPAFWLVIALICAWAIAKNAPGRYFAHGFFVSIFNCVWIVAFHVWMYDKYIANHPNAAEMGTKMGHFFRDHPRQGMIIMGPLFGIMSGLVFGLFAWIASKIMKKPTAAAA
jgi:hypothetical protein